MPKPENAHKLASQQTREELLDAGLRLLVSEPASATLGHLTATKIASEAGRTSGAFFHQWPTLDAYLYDFVGFVLDPGRAANLATTISLLGQGMQRGLGFTEALSVAGEDVPQNTANDPQTVIELLIWNRALHDGAFRDVVARHYEALDAGAGAAYTQLMELLGRPARPPFNAEIIGAICTALAQGLSLRASLTPNLYPRRIFGWIVAALIPLLTRAEDDSRDADDFIRDLPF